MGEVKASLRTDTLASTISTGIERYQGDENTNKSNFMLVVYHCGVLGHAMAD